MTGESFKPNPDSSDIKRPLQKSGLRKPSDRPIGPEYQVAKERYTQELKDILSNPLVPENFNTYADDALNRVVSMIEDMTATYPGVSLPLPRGVAEKHVTEHYEMDIDDLLNSLQTIVNETNQIKEFVRQLSEDETVYVPPRDLQPIIQSGAGEFGKKETAPKLETILFLVEQRYGLNIKDPEQIKVTKGTVVKGMMRKEPYFLVELPTLDRSILVCNEVGNITYVLDNSKLSKIGLESELLVDYDKSQIDELIRTNPHLGIRIAHNTKYIPKIEVSLESIQDFNTKTEAGIDNDSEIVDESLLTENIVKAPEGYMSVGRLAVELGIAHQTLSKIIAELGDELQPIQAKFQARITQAYSPNDIAKIRDILQDKGLFTPPEGYMSAKNIAKELGVDRSTVNRMIAELGDGLQPVQARFSSNVTNAYSPEDIAKIRDLLEHKGLFAIEAPNGYKSVSGIAKEFGVDRSTVSKVINTLGDELQPMRAKLNDQIAIAYSAEDIAKIRGLLEEKGIFTIDAPVGYMSSKGIAKEFGVDRSTVNRMIAELGDELQPVQARFSNNVTNAYSPEDIAKIRGQLKDEEIINP